MVELCHVFLPLTVEGVTIPNRIVCPLMNVDYGSGDGFVTDRLIAFYRLYRNLCWEVPIWVNPNLG